MLAATEACGIGDGGDLAEVDKKGNKRVASGEYPNRTLGESSMTVSHWTTPTDTLQPTSPEETSSE